MAQIMMATTTSMQRKGILAHCCGVLWSCTVLLSLLAVMLAKRQSQTGRATTRALHGLSDAPHSYYKASYTATQWCHGCTLRGCGARAPEIVALDSLPCCHGSVVQEKVFANFPRSGWGPTLPNGLENASKHSRGTICWLYV